MKTIGLKTSAVLVITTLAFATIGGPGCTPDECEIDSDCAATGDPCQGAICTDGVCGTKSLVGTAECECASELDCDLSSDTLCFETSCEENHCVSELAPPGPPPDQPQGDCTVITCDGANREPKTEADPTQTPMQMPGDCDALSCSGMMVAHQPDLMDVPADPVCGQAFCTEAGPSVMTDPDGTTCDPSGFCFESQCMACVPSNPAACGGEGSGEPQNDDIAGAATGDQAQCGFLDGSDIDWFTFFAQDRDFVTNILSFDLWSSAPTVEMCAYVKCSDGSSAGGGCSTKLPGPNGSTGCCYTGNPNGFSQSWDLDCGTTEDSGEVYVSLRSTTASGCETYAINMSY